ncbi:unannotated protein [freshwater metagenome]|uniref:Unannotated protein n=1 Tax=freshwater metagenome TaxID=449393 RepID=A0A6J6IW17_9ZZZZ|nr:hypothetical protein [Actinomycetota bacterium]
MARLASSNSTSSARLLPAPLRRAVLLGGIALLGLAAVACSSSSSSSPESSDTANKGMYVKIVNNTTGPIEAAYFRGGFCLDETTGCTTIASLSSTIAPGAEFIDGFSTAGLCDVGVVVTAAVAPDQPIKFEGGANGSVTQFQSGSDLGPCDKAPAVKVGASTVYVAGTSLKATTTRLSDSTPILTEMEIVVTQP